MVFLVKNEKIIPFAMNPDCNLASTSHGGQNGSLEIDRRGSSIITSRIESIEVVLTYLQGNCSLTGCRHHLLNRKMLSQIAIEDPATFDRLVETANSHAAANAA